jgi:hypothetical protein
MVMVSFIGGEHQPIKEDNVLLVRLGKVIVFNATFADSKTLTLC